MDIQISDILHHRNNKQDRDGDRINWKIEINKLTNSQIHVQNVLKYPVPRELLILGIPPSSTSMAEIA